MLTLIEDNLDHDGVWWDQETVEEGWYGRG
jgi:hypothetical protein